MSESIPFLGSTISLISKSEIRYEGVLYTINAEESVIALAKVRSFGTEDRPTEMPVPARDEVYEYIVFRGSDIKSLQVCDTPSHLPLSGLHNDPAIVQHSAPTAASTYQPTAYNRPIGAIGGSLGSVGGMSLPYGSYRPPPIGHQTLPGGSSSLASTQPNVLVEVLTGSRSSTPTTRKSPVSDAGVQVSPPPQKQERKKSSPPSRPPPQQHYFQNQHQHSNQNYERSYRDNFGQNQRRLYNQYYQGNRGGNQNYQGYYQRQYFTGGRGGGGMGMGMGMGRGRPRGMNQQRGRGGFPQNSTRQRQDQQMFEKDYDFEQANEEFEEMMTQLAKTKITENGDKKEDSGNETTVTDESDECYDKAKSFFDRISCESIERSKGRSQRPDWRQERKTNVQTFGVATTSRRGYYPRGRGGYYNNRGGYYRNYNQGYYRGGNSNSGYRGNNRPFYGNGASTEGSGPTPLSHIDAGSVIGTAVLNKTQQSSGTNSYAAAVRSISESN